MAKRRKSHGHRKGGSRGYRPRSVGKKKIGERFLIVCEGEKTEPSYFESYGVPGLVDVHAEGFGVSPPQLVEIALDRKGNQSQRRNEDIYDQVWCVFDKDDWDDGVFNNAIQRAESQGLKVAYSNEAFELWFLLHFRFFDTPMHRKVFAGKLNELLDRPYKKNATDMYDQLYLKQGFAIKSAQRLLALYSPRNPAKDNPSTTVHLLVQELNRFLPGQR